MKAGKSLISLKSIDKNEVYRYLGYKNSVPDEKVCEIIDKCERELSKEISPRYIYRVFDAEKIGEEIKLKNAPDILKGNDINRHLEGCEKIAVFAATLTEKADKIIRAAQINDMPSAVIFDRVANAAIEQVCDEIEKEVMKSFPEYNQTWRFSPGYGDFPLEIQNELLNLIDAPKKIGLTLTDSLILIPQKSVTAVFGITKNEITKKKQSCNICNLRESCTFRKGGTHCGF